MEEVNKKKKKLRKFLDLLGVGDKRSDNAAYVGNAVKDIRDRNDRINKMNKKLGY